MENKLESRAEGKHTDYTGFTKVDAPVIHTMPRRFINAKVESSDSHKGMGLFILGIGVITFLAGAVFVYFYVFNPKIFTDVNLISDSKIVKQVKKTPEDSLAVVKVEETTINSRIENNKNNHKTIVSDDLEDDNNDDFQDDELLFEDEDEVLGTTSLEKISTSSEVATIVIKNKKPAIIQYLSAPDADADGLSDAEELILGVNKNKVDSDEDGYSDFAELKNSYNPAGDGKLIVNSGITKYNSSKGYSLYYPQNWTVNDSGSEGSAVFKIDDLQFIQIVVAENSDKKSIEDWYKEQFGVESIENEQKVYKSGWESVKNISGLIYYLKKPNQDDIYVVNYSVGADTILYYKNMFLLMIESMEL